jgi:hypothetical protein
MVFRAQVIGLPQGLQHLLVSLAEKQLPGDVL